MPCFQPGKAEEKIKDWELTTEKHVLVNEENSINLENGELKNGVYFIEAEIAGTENQFAKLLINK